MFHSHCGDCPALTEETEIRRVQRRCGGDVRTSGKTIKHCITCIYMYVITAQGEYSELRHDGPRGESKKVSLSCSLR